MDSQNHISFEEARKNARKLNLKSVSEWQKHCQNNDISGLAAFPPKLYKNEWISWGDFLGYEDRQTSKFLSFKEARKFVRKLGLNNCKEWSKYYQEHSMPIDVPHSPQKIYKDKGWISWGDFFGIGLSGLGLTDEEIKFQIKFEKDNIGESIELLRGDMTDKEIIDGYSEEALEILKAVKKYLKENSREREE
jgi:hypothetical protein